MKKIIKTGLLGVALIAATVSNASELKEVKVSVSEVSESKKLELYLSDVVNGEIISITDDKGERVIYNETLSKSSFFTVSIDFSEFKQGVYNLKSVAGSTTKVTPFIVASQRFDVIKGETKIYTKPEITIKDNKVNILVNNESKNPVTIIVYGAGQELSITNKNTDALISKRYDLSKLSSGLYTISVIEGDEVYSEEINL